MLASILLVGGAIRADLHAAILATVVVSIAASTVLVRVFPSPFEPAGEQQTA